MTRGTRLRADMIVGRTVRDARGRAIGKIRELRIELAAPGAPDYVVREVELSSPWWVERLVGPQFSTVVARWLGRRPPRFTVPWERIDLTNPRKPRVGDV